jgi:uncharacterized protein (TIGR03382 family)
MKYLHVGALMALWLASGGASAAGIECDETGGRIVDSHAAVVWVALDDAPVPVTDDPEAQAALVAQTGAPVMTPDDICMQGWVLPAPHPVDPMPTPGVPPVGGRPVSPRPVALPTRLTAVDFAGADVKTAAGTSDGADDGERASAETEGTEGVADTSPSVVIAASDEPTPTPATPAPSLQVKSVDGCSTTGSAAGGLWALLLLAGLRRRRGGR